VYHKQEFFKEELPHRVSDFALRGETGIIGFCQQLLRWDWVLFETPVILGTWLFFEYIGDNWDGMRH
jgi:hypothetical protein